MNFGNQLVVVSSFPTGSVFIKGQVYYNKASEEYVLCFGFRGWAAQGYVITDLTSDDDQARVLKANNRTLMPFVWGLGFQCLSFRCQDLGIRV